MFSSVVRSVYTRSRITGATAAFAGTTGAATLLYHTNYLRAPASNMADSSGEKTAFSPQVNSFSSAVAVVPELARAPTSKEMNRT